MFVCKQFACLKQKRGFVYTKHRVRLKIFRVYVCAYTVHVLDKVKERERERDCHILLTGNSESVSETSLIMIFLTDCDLYFAKTKFDDFRGYGICTVHKNDSTYICIAGWWILHLVSINQIPLLSLETLWTRKQWLCRSASYTSWRQSSTVDVLNLNIKVTSTRT